jgi:hypothetical protein
LTFGRDDDDGGDGVGELDRWWRRFVIDNDTRLSGGFGFRRFARARAFLVGFLANDILVRAPQSVSAMFFIFRIVAWKSSM